ncbi:unknown protein [Oryza sativa Japonica Group]|jgi:hypothetical protein|uniref:Os01g0756300 protein n=7 Tax=Oryza TaxID=4527 RepID=A2ZXY7_ORYSJ|nr:uncharacterized protein LOC4325140 [Oryza sativa Japonica Group]XP_052150613.1 uncharacterized protein LOC127768977 [Oryza glaberrima]EAY75868.1 hypothetical protein OsI_03787 [Oryza sativa Indica Group]KAB8083572.1 hypothetical protein EE612_005810 [Oryza sativa]EAZ13584.1 hypothetical protein OsJ_03501 [Oryza sativa Japonica Group]KAF2952343.1 hypothetical protein DAI22_01g330100 [Oryza sativa Japonica Group]BAB89700.1 unknown protein [Oryza sativa Japonica Group]|eukprot:NP_001044287.1 Os01g0756300 [Oryza sativa Japonica Group]
MDSIHEEQRPRRRQQQQQEGGGEETVVEVPEMDGELLVELLEASLAAEEDEEAVAQRKQQLGFFTADVGDGWDGQELMNSIHPHQEEEGCEDCGLDDILSDFDGGGYPPASSPPYLSEFWMEEMDHATAGPFAVAGECPGEEWYMDGMAMEWEDGRSYYSFHYPSYGADASCTDQLYSSPLWE